MAFSFKGLRGLLSLAVALASTHYALAQSNNAVVIDTIYSTIYSHKTPGGIDPGLLVKTSPNIPFVPGNAVTESVNSTDGGTTPTVVGINIASNRNLQVMTGGGCGVTDSAAIALQDLKARDAEIYEEIMDLLFSQDDAVIEKGGVALSNIRSPLGASDFAGVLYSYSDTTDCSPDVDLKLFDIDKAVKMWQTHEDALKRNPNIDHFFAPWSPPAWMKQPKDGERCSMIRGSLKPEYYGVFGQYLAKSMVAIKDKLGKTPYALSIQNEPQYLPPNYPGNKLTPAQAAEIGELTRAALDKAGLQSVGLTAFDHNWDGYQWPLDLLDNSTSFNSVSWHCYGGEPASQQIVSNAYPLPLYSQYMTECTVITQYNSELWKNLRTQAIRMLIGTIQYGASKSIFWNCALVTDDDGFTTPTLPNVCTNCNAPIVIYNSGAGPAPANGGQQLSHTSTPSSKRAIPENPHQRDGTVARPFSSVSRRQNNNDGKPYYKLTSDYVTLMHFDRATRPRSGSEKNAIRTGVTTSEQKNNNEDGERVRVSAFKTPLADNKHRYSLIVLQKNDHELTGKYENVTLQIGFDNMVANVTLPCGLHTLTWVA